MTIVLKDSLVSPTSTNTIANDNLTMSNTDGMLTYDSEILIENHTTYSQIGISFEDITAGTNAQSTIKSQLGQTEYSARVENLATTQFCSRANSTTATAIVDNHISYSDASVTPVKTVSIGTQINQTNALMTLEYGDNTLLITNQIQSISTASGSELKINAQDNNLSNTHEITIETPLSGDAIISHTVVGTTRNLGISSTGAITLAADNIDLSANGRLIVPSLASGDYLDYDTGKLTIVNDSVGGASNPLLVLQNNTTTAGSVYFETYKNDTPTSTGGDFIGSWSATCNATIGGFPTKTEIARINQIAYGTGAGNNDGGISLACKVNSNINTFLTCNGGASTGEIQVFKPITNPVGDVNISSTNGDVNITTPSAAVNINLTSLAGGITLNAPSINFQSTNTTTGGGANTINWTGTNSGGNNKFLYCSLNGVDIWIPYLTQDPT